MAIDTIKFKRGVKSKLNNLSYGEPAYISDENELYIGTEDGVEKITRNKEVAELSSQLEHIENNIKTSSVVSANVLGFKAEIGFDNTQILTKLINEGFKGTIEFNGGYYEFSEYCFTSECLKLKGLNSSLKGGDGILDTIFVPYNINQRYVFKIGGTKDFLESDNIFNNRVQNVHIEGITFKDTINGENRPVSKALLCLTYAVSCNFDVTFKDIRSRTIYIKNSWELKFTTLAIRKSKYRDYSIYIDKADSDGVSNTSSIIIDTLDVEEFAYGIIYAHKNSVLSNVIINNILIESNLMMYQNKLNVTSLDDFLQCSEVPLFNFGFCEGLTINSINCARLNQEKFTDTNSKYNVFSLFNFDWYANVQISNINLNSNSLYINVCGGEGDNRSNLDITNFFSTEYNKVNENNINTHTYYTYTLKKGRVNILNTNNKKIGATMVTPGVYKNSNLYNILVKSLVNSYIGYNDEFIENYGYIKRDGVQFATFIKDVIVNENMKIFIRLKSSDSNIVVQTDTTELIPITPNVFNVVEINLDASKTYTIQLQNNDATLFIDYIEVRTSEKMIVDCGLINTSSHTTYVEFNENFTKTPLVVVSGVGGTPFSVTITGVNTNGFNIIHNNSDANRILNWIAIQK